LRVEECLEEEICLSWKFFFSEKKEVRKKEREEGEERGEKTSRRRGDRKQVILI